MQGIQLNKWRQSVAEACTSQNRPCQANVKPHAHGPRYVLTLVLLLCFATALTMQGQTFTSLVNFDEANGSWPARMTLVQGLDGKLYGTTFGDPNSGNKTSSGTVFKITISGALTTIYPFCSQPNCMDGVNPNGGLVLGTDGNFYGTTSFAGGGNFGGTVFKTTPAGKLTTLYNFCSQPNCTDGSAPIGPLIQATDGNFYGTTQTGGAHPNSDGGGGTVFKITPSGVLTVLYSFCSHSNCTDGEAPFGGVIQAADGDLYGTTSAGGPVTKACPPAPAGCGTVFKITTAGAFTSLHDFHFGTDPEADVVQASDGNFYGTTGLGGGGKQCSPDGSRGCGTVYKMKPGGLTTTLYSFCTRSGCPDGATPVSPLLQATDGNFYSTARGGGEGTSPGDGTVFKITPSGALTVLHSFVGPDGNGAASGLVQATDGNFYGTTWHGGTAKACDPPPDGGCGTVFKLSVGLRPLVKTLPTSGNVEAKVFILGTDLSGTTAVDFNGTPARFTVVSPTEIKTTVPSGATAGTVTVRTPKGTLKSNVPFRVH